MTRIRRIDPLHIILVLLLLIMLPLGVLTLATALGATPVAWLASNTSASPTTGASHASSAPATNPSDHNLNVAYVPMARATTPPPLRAGATYLPIISR